MKGIAFIAVLAMFAAGGTRAGSLTWYASQAAFDSAEPGLPVQSFDSAHFNPPYALIANHLNADTNDGVFAPGDILPNLDIYTKRPGSPSNALIVYGGGPVDTVSVGNNWYGDTLILSFPSAVTAVGETVFGATSGGPSFAGKIHEDVFSGSKRLGGMTFREQTGGSVYIGVAAPRATPITQVRITWQCCNDATTYVSSLAFGSPAQ